MSVERKRVELRVSGRVQGVFFRASTQEQARARNLSGWVKNRADGSVEAVLEGPVKDLRAVVEWAHRGPEAADVEAVEVGWLEPLNDLDTFEVRR